MASSWLSRRPHCRRLGGRGHSWRRASAKGILQLRVPTPRLCRAVMLRPARTDMGRVAVAHSPRGGMLLTKAAFNRNARQGRPGVRRCARLLGGRVTDDGVGRGRCIDQSAARYVDRHQCLDHTDIDNAPLTASCPLRSIAMIKDIIVHLEHRIARDPARDFAITVAETFDAHVAGVAFAYTPDFPGYVMLETPPDILAQMMAESEKAALAAIERFDAAARRSLISAEHRLLKAIGASAPVVLARLARRYDLSVFVPSEPNVAD